MCRVIEQGHPGKTVLGIVPRIPGVHVIETRVEIIFDAGARQRQSIIDPDIDVGFQIRESPIRIERAVQRDLGGWSAWICSAEDLIIQKAVAGRGKDWPDVEALLIEQHGKLDEAYIEEWLAEFADALDKSEIVTEYRRLREQVDQAAR